MTRLAIVVSGLSWVIVDSRPRHVSEFAQFPPRRRPSALCPQCGRPLILKLGSRRRHHAAHQPGWTCPAIRGESALHLDCKLSLAASLERAGPDQRVLTIRQCCAGAGSAEACDRADVREWARDWDDVVVERSIDNARRPDIVLLRDGHPIGAIEIVATNAMTAEKTASLAELHVPWIEVAASEALAQRDASSIPTPLDTRRANDLEPWRCPVHAELHAKRAVADAQARAEQREREREREREAIVLRAARVVDIYHPGGSRERVVYRVIDLLRDGQRYASRLTRGTLLLSEQKSSDALRDVYRADVAHLAKADGAFADSPMRWATGAAAEFIVHEGAFDRVPRDPTVLVTTYPRRWFYSPDRREWFLPHDMRRVRWDRAPGDLMLPHPAWTGSRAVRERPAPEGSWATPIFAQRPIAAMFSAGVAATSNEHGIAIITNRDARWAIVVLQRAVDDPAAIAHAASAVADAGVAEAVWLSHPRDWRPLLDDCAWAPAGRDQRGFGAVLVEGTGVYRADAFVRALNAGDSQVLASAIRAASARRVAALRREAASAGD